jgi:ABC-type nickel/cobalt efflux system permease component RcnA
MALLGLGMVLLPAVAAAHPMGNFSISHYAAISVARDGVEIRYLIDMAEIPTFQEIQDSGIVPEPDHPSLAPYLRGRAETLKAGLHVELNGRRLTLRNRSREVLFTPGAGDLPTMKLALVYRAGLEGAIPGGLNRLRYRDDNFRDRAGWKEVVAVVGPEVVLASSTVPATDRSRQLSDYPTDLLNSPPQQLEAQLTVALPGAPGASAALGPSGRPSTGGPPSAGPDPSRSSALPDRDRPAGTTAGAGPSATVPAPVQSAVTPAPAVTGAVTVQPNRQSTPRDAFTDLVSTTHMGPGMILFAAAVAATLGAFHALEPGHGKTVVAAYLVGSRGTAAHAVLLGLIVTASHTAGVYLLGGVTLYASRYIVPERLYPWLGVTSGLIIAGLGLYLFLRRYAGETHPHGHGHSHHPGHSHDHGLPHTHEHAHDQHHHHGHHHVPAGTVSIRQLLALGITGGIVPCPAALVVLLSAVALRRIGFGLFLIVAFSVGLAAVLVAIGLLMVYARRFMTHFQGEGPLVTRWLPLASSAVITVLGIAIAAQALLSAGIVQVRLG